MLLETSQATLVATIQILLMAGVGFALVKTSLLDEPGLDMLSNLLVKVFLPQMIFYHLTQHFHFSDYTYWWGYPLLSVGIVLSGVAVSRALLVFNKGCRNRNHFTALMAFANYGYVPLMLVASLFDGQRAESLTVTIFLMIMGFDFAVWSMGVWLLTSHKDKTIYWGRLLNPPFVTTVASLLLIMLGWHRWVPPAVIKPVKMFSDCALPLSMIVTGGNLAKTNLQAVDKTDMRYLIFGKLILLPALALVAVKALALPYVAGFMLVVQAAVPSAVSLSMMIRYYKVDSELINQGIFWDSLISVLTIPVVLTVYNFITNSY
ncbi:MAG TPA: AEC family transporter [Candidatus Omnitrophota bacterium]|nr:AEC family transporter [Candidatus Omnitrophota bacterium]HQO59001.1 AEC family transporter [Candidatus Omnitrophota bacterium]HQP12743.1 AEC family transporter [Candidatus Omnitrophota bacterium]